MDREPIPGLFEGWIVLVPRGISCLVYTYLDVESELCVQWDAHISLSGLVLLFDMPCHTFCCAGNF